MKLRFLLAASALAILASACCSPKNETICIIPEPQIVNFGEGSFDVARAAISIDPAVCELGREHIAEFAIRLGNALGSPRQGVEGLKDSGIRFIIDKKLAEEQYVIDITPECADIKASTAAGLFYAIQSLSQLLPDKYFNPDAICTEIETCQKPKPCPKSLCRKFWKIPAVHIEDSPRFAYRGMHLDVSRHFFGVDFVKKYLDVMALHKINRFHWHLSDDQGWRIEIKKYPRLTSVGSTRPETMLLKNFEPYVGDGIPHGGYYTQDEIREVVAYAASKHITVIPEIDLPGHMIAAMAAYPELGCTGGPYKVWQIWGVANEVLCPGKEKTFEFIEGVLDEIIELFPSEYIHIGGDECPKSAWEKCPDCQKRIAELGLKTDEKHTAEQYLQNYVTARVQDYLNARGRKIIGWDEILEGNLAKGATVMSWRGAAGGIEAAKNGFDAIMVPAGYLYFDYYQSEAVEKEPFAICCPSPIEKTYSFEPLEGIPAKEQKHILGVQANLWTEYISTPAHAEYMVLPRMDALSELQWCQPERKDYERFKEGVARMMRIYDALGYSYSRNIFGEPGLPGYTGPLGQ